MNSSVENNLTGKDNEDNFRPSFKYYKRKNPPPDLSQVLEINEECKVYILHLSFLKMIYFTCILSTLTN